MDGPRWELKGARAPLGPNFFLLLFIFSYNFFHFCS